MRGHPLGVSFTDPLLSRDEQLSYTLIVNTMVNNISTEKTPDDENSHGAGFIPPRRIGAQTAAPVALLECIRCHAGGGLGSSRLFVSVRLVATGRPPHPPSRRRRSTRKSAIPLATRSPTPEFPYLPISCTRPWTWRLGTSPSSFNWRPAP